MPQLNLAPWFYILIMSWLVYLMVLPKTGNMKTPNNPTDKYNQETPNHWNWPWT
uniref:ATP synthase complex subunit 8 n=1 Tax=Hemidactylium scutatum TaxID=291265 RepID=Q644G1_9SALA|nr:ATP synthase F0 subunit 8 [Hemidactylium scutatum]AAU20673.1 ATP synthase F0 subunit 8 [Hemidactylium scutatum]